MIDDVWWIFSENREPVKHIDNLFPKHSEGFDKPWAYIVQRGNWFWFDEYARQWKGNWIWVPELKNVPADYQAQLFLLGV